jgi:hypothetical protein
MKTFLVRTTRINKSKSFPFIILFFIHLFLLGLTFYKKGKKTSSSLVISIGIAYVFEYFVLNLFRMYRYYPKVFKKDWIDSVFGALLSQSVYVPIAATMLSLFNLGWKWRMGISFIYGVIERLFIHWGIYRNKTWNTFLTITTLPIYFYIVARWWNDMQRGNRIKEFFSIFFCYWINYTNIFYFCLALIKQYRFRIGFLKDKYQEHFILVPIYTAISGMIGTLNTIYVRKKSKWKGLLVLHIFDRILFKYKVIHPSKTINLYSLIPIHLCVLFIGEYISNVKNRPN